jgi:hypothetical protein
MRIAVKPEHDSNQGRSTEPKRNIESVHARKVLAPRPAEGSPPQPRWLCARAIEEPRLTIGLVNYVRTRLSSKLELSDILVTQGMQQALRQES